MSTTYPSAIDNGTSIPVIIDLVTPVKAQSVNILRDAIISIENELGLSPSAEFATVAERLDYLTTLALQCGTGGGGTLTPPSNPADNYRVAFASSGDLDYASGVSVLTSQNGLSLGGLLLISQSSLITTPSTPNALLYQNSGSLRFYYNSVDRNVLFAPISANENDVLTYSSGSWLALPPTGGAATNAYSNITDGTTTASAGTADTIRFRSANNLLTTVVGSNDPTYGDNLLLTVNQSNIDHGSVAGLLDDDHTQYVHNTSARTITARHIFNPVVSNSPFLLGTNAQGQLVTGLNSDQLDGQEGSYYQNAGNLNAGTLLAARFNDTSHGSRSGGTLHSTVTNSLAGFIPAVGILNTIPQSTGTGISYVSELTNSQKITVAKAGITVSSRSLINFIDGYNTTITAVDNSGRVDITISSTGSGVSNAYANVTDGTTTATASGLDTVRFRSANNLLTTIVGSNDPTYGDNLLLTVNQSNIDHGSIAGLLDDDHTQYVHNTTNRTITAQHTFNYLGSPFLLGANSQNQFISGLNSDRLDGYDGSYYLSTIRLNSGSNVGTKNRLNFIAGANVTLSAVDDVANDEVAITINSTGGGTGGLSNAYSNITDGYTTASAVASDTIRFRSANNILTTAVGSDDVTYGDNLLLTVNQSNIDHGSIAGLSDDDHSQYVHNTIARTITSQHTFNYTGAPFILGASSQNQLVIGLNSDLLDGYNGSYYLSTVRLNSGSNTGTRNRLNFIAGTNTTLSAVDDLVNDEVAITINSTPGSGGLANAYTSITDGTTTATSVGSDVITFRSANNILTAAVGSNDVTYGDNLLLTINQANIDHGSIAGISDDDHTQYVHNVNNRTIIAQHTFNYSGSPFLLGTGSQNQLVQYLNSDLLDGYDGSYYLSTVRLNSGSNVGTRNRLNFIAGANITLSATDDIINNEVAVTINAAGGTSGLSNAYTNITDGTTTAVAVGADTITFRSANNILTTAVGSNDVTYGDNLLLTVNQNNIDHGSIAGLSDDDHSQYVHNTINRAITAQHTFNYSGSPFVIGSSSQNQLVQYLNSDMLDGYDGSYYLSTVRINGGVDIGTRNRLNFIPGTNVTISATDDPTNGEIDITINSSGGSGAAGALFITGFSGVASTDLNAQIRIGSFYANATGYTTATFYAILETTNVGATCEIELYDVTAASFITSSILTTTSLTASLVSTILTIPTDIKNSNTVYEIYLRRSAGIVASVRCTNVSLRLS